MKKLTISLIAVVILGGISFGFLYNIINHPSEADSMAPEIDDSLNKGTAIADNNDTIIISLFSYDLSCGTNLSDPTRSSGGTEGQICPSGTSFAGSYPGKDPVENSSYINRAKIASGDGATLWPTSFSTDTNGYVYLNIKSSIPGNKTINVYASGAPDQYPYYTKTVTFTSTNGNSSDSTSSDSTSTEESTDQSATTAQKPAAPTVATINNQAIGTNNTFSGTIYPTDKIIISGKTIANATVTLYIYSNPTTAEVKSDKDGNWTYTIVSLPVGSHRVEAVVTDSSGNKSDKAQIAQFSVKAASVTKTANKYNITPTILYVFIGIWILVIGVIVFLIIKKWKKRKLNLTK